MVITTSCAFNADLRPLILLSRADRSRLHVRRFLFRPKNNCLNFFADRQHLFLFLKRKPRAGEASALALISLHITVNRTKVKMSF